LSQAVNRIASAEIDLVLFTTSVQVLHLLKLAKRMSAEERLRNGLADVTIGSIGPVTSAELREQGIHVDFEPEHPKMGYLVNEAARRMSARKVLPSS
jgi:uroporphyrinogen-III synthase